MHDAGVLLCKLIILPMFHYTLNITFFHLVSSCCVVSLGSKRLEVTHAFHPHHHPTPFLFPRLSFFCITFISGPVDLQFPKPSHHPSFRYDRLHPCGPPSCQPHSFTFPSGFLFPLPLNIIIPSMYEPQVPLAGGPVGPTLCLHG